MLRHADFKREGVKSASKFNLILYPGNTVNFCMSTLMELRDVVSSSRDFKHLLDTVHSGLSLVDDTFDDCSSLAFCEHACSIAAHFQPS